MEDGEAGSLARYPSSGLRHGQKFQFPVIDVALGTAAGYCSFSLSRTKPSLLRINLGSRRGIWRGAPANKSNDERIQDDSKKITGGGKYGISCLLKHPSR
jgi:hypothetical protein